MKTGKTYMSATTSPGPSDSESRHTSTRIIKAARKSIASDSKEEFFKFQELFDFEFEQIAHHSYLQMIGNAMDSQKTRNYLCSMD